MLAAVKSKVLGGSRSRGGVQSGTTVAAPAASPAEPAVGHDDSGSFEKRSDADDGEAGGKDAGQLAAAANSDPFGDETNAEVKYRTMKWWQTGMVMVAETVSLGILSLPSALATLGLIP